MSSSSSSSSRLSSLFGPSSRAHTLIQQHPRATKPDGSYIKYDYGTSGFRGLATTLDSVTLRFGMLMVLRALSMGKTSIPTPLISTQKEIITPARTPVVGLMITASHNEEKDNGLKACDPSGEMLATSWESIATTLANESEANAATFLRNLSEQHNLDWSITPRLFIGRDTRTSSPHLAALVVAGIQALGGQVVDFGLLTTPQLHWIVHEFNLGRQASLEIYYKTLSRSFMILLQKEDGSHRQLEPLILDCANGVGGSACHVLASAIEKVLKLEIRNDKNSGLNDRVGAEHVQKTRTLPLGYDKTKDKGKKMASIDGDADRLVYYYINTKGDVRLLDGDKILALCTLFLRDLIHATNLNLSMGIVQTAYANGASTIYMQEELKVPVQCTPTGVKHLHHKALEYDVGVYFESNGHGTVIVNEKTKQQLKQVASTSGPAATAATRLLAVVDMVNQCVGDAISDLLLVEVALAERGWSLPDWDALYEDLPSSMLKVYVADRSIIQTTDAERRCIAPQGLQEAIDTCIAAGKGTATENAKRRAFVRPSGTEDVVRVYAEANTRQEVDELAQQVCGAVFQLAGGIKK